jgi:hypothetical protein
MRAVESADAPGALARAAAPRISDPGRGPCLHCGPGGQLAADNASRRLPDGPLQAVRAALRVLQLCAKASKYIEGRQLYKAFKTLETIQGEHGDVLRWSGGAAAQPPLLPTAGVHNGSASRDATPLKPPPGALVAGGAADGGDGGTAELAEQLGPLAAHLRGRVAQLVAQLEQRAVADFNDWLAAVRAQAGTIGMRAVRWAAAERQQEETLARQRKLLLPALDGLRDVRAAGALAAQSLQGPGVREAPPATPLPLPSATAGTPGAAAAAATPPGSASAAPAEEGSPPASSGSTSGGAARHAAFRAARQAAGTSPTRTPASGGGTAAVGGGTQVASPATSPPGTAASSNARLAAAEATAAAARTPPPAQPPGPQAANTLHVTGGLHTPAAQSNDACAAASHHAQAAFACLGLYRNACLPPVGLLPVRSVQAPAHTPLLSFTACISPSRPPTLHLRTFPPAAAAAPSNQHKTHPPPPPNPPPPPTHTHPQATCWREWTWPPCTAASTSTPAWGACPSSPNHTRATGASRRAADAALRCLRGPCPVVALHPVCCKPCRVGLPWAAQPCAAAAHR